MKTDTPSESFKAGTGMMGATEPGQKVTRENVHLLPVGSVVRNGDCSRLIRLHGDLWLWCKDSAHCYSDIGHLSMHLDDRSVACHVAPAAHGSLN